MRRSAPPKIQRERAARLLEVAVEALVEVPQLEQLGVRELEHETFVDRAAQRDRGAPVHHEQVVRGIGERESKRVLDAALRERALLGAQDLGECVAQVRLLEEPARGERRLERLEVEHGVLLVDVAVELAGKRGLEHVGELVDPCTSRAEEAHVVAERRREPRQVFERMLEGDAVVHREGAEVEDRDVDLRLARESSRADRHGLARARDLERERIEVEVGGRAPVALEAAPLGGPCARDPVRTLEVDLRGTRKAK